MRKLIYYVASTEDHFIADKNGGIDWLEDERWEIEGEDYGYYDFYAGIDTTLMGYKTYAHVMDMDVPFPYPDKQNYVFTSHPDPLPCDEVCFVHQDVEGFVRKAKEEPKESNIWLVGGGELAGALLKANLIDELYMTVMPVNLGEGRALFGKEPWPANATLLETREYPNGVRKERWKL
jgi:dihydrofolate reductase